MSDLAKPSFNLSSMLIVFIAVAFFIFSAATAINAQTVQKNQNWKLFVSEDRSFQIELPGEPTRRAKFFEGEPNERIYFRCTDSIESAYGYLFDPPSRSRTFDIGVFKLTKCKRRSSDFDKDTMKVVKAYSADDPDDTILRDELRTVNGSRVRLVVVRTAASNIIWEMFVETKMRMYWLGYGSRNPADVNSVVAGRILNSFKPLVD